MELLGHVAIVTGGSAGIGLAATRELVRAGATVVVVGRTPQRMERAVASLGEGPGQTMGILADVRSESDMARMAAATVERFGRIDTLVAAAGILRASEGVIRPVAQTRLAEWDEVLDINLKGTFLANRAVLPSMIARRSGLIVNVASTSGRKGYAYDAAYCTSKFAVIGLSQSLQAEVRGYGVRVQALLPGAIDTPMWDQNGPIPRPMDVVPVEEVGRLVHYLISLPTEVCMGETIIEPLKVHERPAWLGGGHAG